MKKSLILIIAMIFFFQLSEKSHAAFYLEPLVGIQLASSFESGREDGKSTGNQIGARVGFEKLGFSLGLDGRRNSLSIDPGSNTSATDYTGNQIGFFVGYEFPVLFRVWGNYIFTGSVKDDDNSDVKLTKAGGFNLGIGYKILPFISMNIEYFNLNFDESDNSGTTTDSDFESEGLLLGFSIPLSL